MGRRGAKVIPSSIGHLPSSRGFETPVATVRRRCSELAEIVGPRLPSATHRRCRCL